jgi:Alpha-L-fucosidase
MRKFLLSSILTALIMFFSSFIYAQKEATPEIIQARKEFQDNKFGIFLHWGIYSMTAQGEWYMHNRNIHRDEYAKLASGFYPSKFNAEEWVKAIKLSGAKYICITTRHHDGFSMFDTKYCDFNIVKATPFKRDIIKELADECEKQGIKLHFYYSHLDWRRDDYPQGRTGKGTGRKEGHGDWKSYYTFMNNQLTELLTNYGKVGAIWFDGAWDMPRDFDWQLTQQYDMIHKLQPWCLIGNNHHGELPAREDIQIFERDLPGENKAGLSEFNEVGQLPLETCQTMNGMWGYKIEDQNYKSTKDLIHYLVTAAGKNANLLMNIGPQPNGELPAVAVERLKEVGEWMNVYGETIHGTRGGDVAPHSWGVSTRKGDKLYIHILNLQDKALFLPLNKK